MSGVAPVSRKYEVSPPLQATTQATYLCYSKGLHILGFTSVDEKMEPVSGVNVKLVDLVILTEICE